MLSKGVVNPGLDQPPPRLGEGDRDRDMYAGVPGIGGKGWANPFAGSPEEAPPRNFEVSGSERLSADVGNRLAADEERRRRCDPLAVSFGEWGARL